MLIEFYQGPAHRKKMYWAEPLPHYLNIPAMKVESAAFWIGPDDPLPTHNFIAHVYELVGYRMSGTIGQYLYVRTEQGSEVTA